MMKQLYPHLTEYVYVDSFFDSLITQYGNTKDSAEQNRIRKQMHQLVEDWDMWLVRHGYECGAHYFYFNHLNQQNGLYEQGYRFASGALATAFLLGVLK